MIVKLPIIKEQNITDTGQVENIRGELVVNIDTSFAAHLKWEENFQEKMGCDLTEYTQRVNTWLKTKKNTSAHFVSILKLLYCYINSKELPTFLDFCKLFNYEIAEELTEKITQVLDQVGNSMVSSKNF